MAKTPRKGAHVPDPNFLAQQRTIHKLFTTRQTDFEAFDADFAAPFADNWLADILVFEDIPTDETMRDEIQEWIEAAETKRKLCAKKLAELLHFVTKAFPDNERKMLEFGFNPRSVSRTRNPILFALEMTATRLILADHSSALLAAGMPPALPGQLDDLNDELFDAVVKKAYTERLRLRTTEKRNTQYNKLWKIYSQVRDAASTIYHAKPTSRQLFELELKKAAKGE